MIDLAFFALVSTTKSRSSNETLTLGRKLQPAKISRFMAHTFRFSDLQRVLNAIDTAQPAAAVHRPTISAA